ncbi:MAG: type II secretion system F family protein [Planctomycetota bacterium]|jgi:tight adherence protein B
MNLLIIGIAAFIGVAALVGGLAVAFREKPASKAEDRLDLFTGTGQPASTKEDRAKEAGLLMEPLDSRPGFFESLMNRFGNFSMLFEQADTSLTVPRLVGISAFIALAGAGLGAATGLPFTLLPVVAVLMGLLPLAWLMWRRKRRMKAFAVQLPDALEMLARALRAGQSLNAGFNMVASEMSDPIAKEFGIMTEQQNLGIPLEDALKDMCERIPNLDLKFFATAVILQRQTGGDLAEILEKIGSLIRQRFQIWGQVQALTGEGRLSGIVLMALPVLLFFAVYHLNRDYVMLLFTDSAGKKMLGVAIFLQVLGALVIRKIVNIKV